MNAITRNAEASQFELRQDGLTAVAEYVLEQSASGAGVMRVTHVVVPVPWRGRGVASQLAQAIIDFARDESLNIVPQCPFMAAYFARHPELNDLMLSRGADA